MRSPRALLGWAWDTAFRYLPHATRPGLRRIGHPGPDSPVLLTGNFTLTVRRLTEVLEGRDAWLLVANSRGINVWCAAGGGHLTDHDVIAVLRASDIEEHVAHRTLVLPQLAATGIERRHITEVTGWETKWGPARLEDLPELLDRDLRPKKSHRLMRFPLWERLEMALMWGLPLSLIGLGVVGALVDWLTGAVTGGLVLASVSGLFGSLPRLRMNGWRRWLAHGGFAVLGAAAGVAALFALGHLTSATALAVSIASLVAMALLSIDLAGTTPWYPSSINSVGEDFRVALDDDRCTGTTECVQVCPRDVLRMNGGRRKVEIVRPDQCIRCGACIVQCPEDALFFRSADGRVVEPSTVRSTRLNMLGKRTVQLAAPSDERRG